jgi:hypothetical protein
MSLTFFLVGGVIFSVYMFFTIWNIYNGSKSPGRNGASVGERSGDTAD